MGYSENPDGYGDTLTRHDSDLLIAVGCIENRLTNSQGLYRFGYHFFSMNNGQYRHICSVRVVDLKRRHKPCPNGMNTLLSGMKMIDRCVKYTNEPLKIAQTF